MRHFVTTSMLATFVLLAGAVCLAQDTKPDAAGAKTDSPEMWEAYKKMWEGQWETTFQMADGGEGRGECTAEVILDGHAVLISRTWNSPQSSVKQMVLGCWCPKQKAIVLHGVGGGGGQMATVIKLVDGEEHATISRIAADGTENSSRTVSTVIDKDTCQVRFLEGQFEGAEITWKRKKN